MGFVFKPIPPEVWKSMPPDVQRQVHIYERAFLMDMHRRDQHGSPSLGLAIILLGAIAAGLLLTRAF